MTIKWSFLGLSPYEKAMALQGDLRDQVQNGATLDYLLLLHHPPLITRGISERGDSGLITPRRQLEEQGIPVFDVDRGGKTTVHGPGQLVGYLVFDLKRRNLRTRDFVERVANVLITVLDSYSIDAHYDAKDPGIMIGDAKVAFLGFAIQKNVTTHGFALNVNRDVKLFENIIPCGKVDRKITSMEMVVNRPFSMYDVYWRVVTTIGQLFEDDMEEIYVDSEIMM